MSDELKKADVIAALEKLRKIAPSNLMQDANRTPLDRYAEKYHLTSVAKIAIENQIAGAVTAAREEIARICDSWIVDHNLSTAGDSDIAYGNVARLCRGIK